MKQPWLSVLMPVYNGEAYLASALDSILLQGDNDIECIAVDGNSTDRTVSILKSYQDKLPLQVLHRERDSNWVIKTNHALSFAKGEYVCFLHHDDLWLKGRLQIMRQFVENYPQVGLFLHSSYFIDIAGKTLGLWSCPLPAYPKIISPNLLIEKLLIQNFISILAPVFKRDFALKVGGMDEKLWYTADWDFWLKIAACGNTMYYPKPLSGFRIHPNSQTVVRSSYLQDFRKQLDAVYEKHLLIWKASEKAKRKIEGPARFSIEVNSALAGFVHHRNPEYLKLAVQFFLLGPWGGYRYIMISRIIERVSARLKTKLQLSHSNKL